MNAHRKSTRNLIGPGLLFLLLILAGVPSAHAVVEISKGPLSGTDQADDSGLGILSFVTEPEFSNGFVNTSFAAPGGNKGKPGGGGGGGDGGGGGVGGECSEDARFPALIYPVDSGDGNGTDDLVVASSDGCVTQIVEEGIQLGVARLKYDEFTGSGYYAWSENVDPGNSPGRITRRNFVVTGGSLTLDMPEDLYVGVSYLYDFDLQGDLLTVLDEQSGQESLLVIALSSCGGSPCDGSDAVSVYTRNSPSVPCLQDADIVGCYEPASSIAMAHDGKAIYFGVEGQHSDGNRVSGIARVFEGGGGWVPQTPELFLRHDIYYEAGVTYYEAGLLGLSEDDRYLAIRYLAGFQNRGRDDRVIIFDTWDVRAICPCEAGSFYQDFPAWTATWTEEDTLYLLGTEGNGRKLRHPIEEFDPVTGTRRSIGISLENHPRIDSSL